METDAPELKEFEVKFKIDPSDHPLGMEFLTETIHAVDMAEACKTASCLSNIAHVRPLN